MAMGKSFITIYLTVVILFASMVSNAQENREKQKPLHKFEIGFSVGFSTYDFDNINSGYIENFAQPRGYIDTVLNGHHLSNFELGYRLNQKISLYLGTYIMWRGTSGRADYTYIEAADYGGIIFYGTGDLFNDLDIFHMSPYLKLKYRFLVTDKFELFTAAAVAVSYGRAMITSEIRLDYSPPPSSSFYENDKFIRAYSDVQPGFFGGPGITFKFDRNNSITLEANYHYLSTGPLTDEDGNDWIVNNFGSKLSLEVSGWGLNLGYHWHF